MLLRFSVANHASIRDEQDISMIAVDKHPDLAVQHVPGSSLTALPVVAVFGKNASGKSNLLEAIFFVWDSIRNSHQRWLPEDGVVRRNPFLLQDDYAEKPSRFVTEFVFEDTRFEYGFECTDDEFTREWLYSFPEKNRKRTLFERASGESIRFGPHFTGQRKNVEELTRPNSLFLSAAAANNHKELTPIYHWFYTNLRVAHPENATGRLEETLHIFENHEDQKPELLSLLSFADFDIVGLSVEREKLPPERRQKIAELLSELDESAVDASSIRGRAEIAVVHDMGDGDTATLPLEFESSGTQAWLELIGPVFNSIRRGSLLVVDELDARLHPILTGHLVRLYQDPQTNPKGAQLLFNTHDATLLGPNAPCRLRRDQVWFAERNADKATELYPLIEYRVREGLDNVERSYLRGRYGAIPEIDDTIVPSLEGAGAA